MLRFGIISTAKIAADHVVPAIQDAENCVVTAVASRDIAKAKAFAERFAIDHAFGSYDEMLASDTIDAVYIPLPTSQHVEWSIKAANAGKHVLCEKPLATDYVYAREMVEAAETAGVVNMINLSYRRVPALQKAAEMVAAGEIGQVRHFEASYLQSWLTNAVWGDWRTDPRWLWRLSTAHGSKGALGDVGIHIIDFATYIAGSDPAEISCRLKTFHKAEGDRIGDYVLDANDSFLMHLELANGATGTITASRFASGHHNDLKMVIHGDKGALEVTFFKFESRLRACLGADMDTETWQEVETPPVLDIYDRFIDCIRGHGTMDPDFKRGARLQHVMDCAFQSSDEACRSIDVREPLTKVTNVTEAKAAG